MILPTEADFNARTLKRPLLGGTTKTGLSFGLPAVLTCPVVSGICHDCYAKNRGSYRFRDVKAGQRRRLAIALTDSFVPRLVGELITAAIAEYNANAKVLRFRLHDSGDFFDCQYIEDWISILQQVAEAKPPIPVYAWIPTRVWAATTIPIRITGTEKSNPLTLLRKLNAVPHVSVRSSCLRANDAPPKIEGLAAGHGVLENEDSEEIESAHMCPVSRATRHNRRQRGRWHQDVPAQPTSCTEHNCSLCYSRETPIVFLKH